MMDYPYSNELHPPQKTADIDVTRPGTKVMLKILVKTHQKQTEAFVPPAGVTLRRETIENVPCFVLEPEGAGDIPAMLYCHGGAFYLPTQVTSLNLACIYAKQANIRVVLPEYSLTPDHPAPKALEECRAVQRALKPQLVYGESAGAAIAALLEKCWGQMLIYPVTDDRSGLYPSMEKCALAVWTANSNKSMWAAYLRDYPEEKLAEIIPMRRENWRGASPAYIETQEFDILRDEGEAFAKHLQAATVPVDYHLIPGSYHGFDGELDSPLVRRVLEQRIAWIKSKIQ